MSWYRPEKSTRKSTQQAADAGERLVFSCCLLQAETYEARVIKQKALPVPVISVGNLTVGGTGKTPITIDLSRGLLQQGLKVAILSRGYKRQSSQNVLVVSDGRQILVDAQQAGDEPYLIAKSVPGAVVIVSADRFAAGRIAVQDYACDVLLLDDGFQHLRVARNFDLLVYDYNDDPQELKLLPPVASESRSVQFPEQIALSASKVPEKSCPARMSAIRVMANRVKAWNTASDLSV